MRIRFNNFFKLKTKENSVGKIKIKANNKNNEIHKSIDTKKTVFKVYSGRR